MIALSCSAFAMSLAATPALSATPLTPESIAKAQSLAGELGSTAKSTEESLNTTTPKEVEAAVQPALKELIVSEGAAPNIVLAALTDVLGVCKDGKAAKPTKYSCPVNAGSYSALRNLLKIVAALEENSLQPAAGPPQGGAPFGAPPTTSSGGQDYSAT